MARLLMRQTVTVRGKGWSTKYFAGRYYGENHAEFLKDASGSYEVIEDKREYDVFDFEEPELVDEENGIGY